MIERDEAGVPLRPQKVSITTPLEQQLLGDTDEDKINRPNHYNWHPRIECKDVVGYFGYNKGTALAYIWRSAHKGTERDDLQKAIKHLQFELELLDIREREGS